MHSLLLQILNDAFFRLSMTSSRLNSPPLTTFLSPYKTYSCIIRIPTNYSKDITSRSFDTRRVVSWALHYRGRVIWTLSLISYWFMVTPRDLKLLKITCTLDILSSKREHNSICHAFVFNWYLYLCSSLHISWGSNFLKLSTKVGIQPFKISNM